MLFSACVSLFLAIFAVAVPTPEGGKHEKCKTNGVKLVLPAGQTNLTAPTGDPSFVLLGVGYQNYTCGAAGTYTSAGAVASLFDVSCSKNFDKIHDHSGHKYAKLGDHYFQSNGNGGIAPVWDFRADSAKNQPDAYVVAARVAGLAAPTGKQDIDWLQLRGVTGSLATSIYRTHTKGGQPPASCSPGSGGIQVYYISLYWLFGSTITVS